MESKQTLNKTVFEQNNGILRTSEILRLGIHPRKLYQMKKSGELIELSRGVFRLNTLSELENSDFVAVCKRVPIGVICLISALNFHQLTNEIPHEVYIAVPRRKEKPKIDYPPTRVFHFSEDTFLSGIEEHSFDGNLVKIYSPEKTIADCFKFRNKIGLDVAIEALKRCLKQKGSRSKILEYAKICRIEKVIKPYLEVLQ
jgi:predicted transcriptional regulator of viral defense system